MHTHTHAKFMVNIGKKVSQLRRKHCYKYFIFLEEQHLQDNTHP